MRQFRFRGWLTLDKRGPHGAEAKQYPSGTHKLMVHARCLVEPGYDKYFPAVLTRDDEQPLSPGDHAIVTVTLVDDEAPAFFAPGQHFTVWQGADVGQGIVSRRVFCAGGPS